MSAALKDIRDRCDQFNNIWGIPEQVTPEWIAKRLSNNATALRLRVGADWKEGKSVSGAMVINLRRHAVDVAAQALALIDLCDEHVKALNTPAPSAGKAACDE